MSGQFNPEPSSIQISRMLRRPPPVKLPGAGMVRNPAPPKLGMPRAITPHFARPGFQDGGDSGDGGGDGGDGSAGDGSDGGIGGDVGMGVASAMGANAGYGFGSGIGNPAGAPAGVSTNSGNVGIGLGDPGSGVSSGDVAPGVAASLGLGTPSQASPGSQAAMGEAATMGLGQNGALGGLNDASPVGNVSVSALGPPGAATSAGSSGGGGNFGGVGASSPAQAASILGFLSSLGLGGIGQFGNATALARPSPAPPATGAPSAPNLGSAASSPTQAASILGLLASLKAGGAPAAGAPGPSAAQSAAPAYAMDTGLRGGTSASIPVPGQGRFALGGRAGFAVGGLVDDPNNPVTGPIISAEMGRADTHPTHVPPGAYVVKAEDVAHLGQGNSMAGLKLLGDMFGPPLGERGIPSPMPGAAQPSPMHVGRGMPIPEPQKTQVTGFPQYKIGYQPYQGSQQGPAARGGVVPDKDPDEAINAHLPHLGTPVNLSGGEFVISPEEVKRRGKGDLELGHEAIDQWVRSLSKEHIKTLKALPGPAK